MSDKKRKRNHKTTAISRRHISPRKAALAIVVLLMIVIVIWKYSDNKPDSRETYPECYWPKEKILASDENLVTYTRSWISRIATAQECPDVHPQTFGGISSKDYLLDFVSDGGRLDLVLLEIQEGRKFRAKVSQEKFKIILVPDNHMSCLNPSGDKKTVVARQRRIVDYVDESPCKLFFAEGINFVVNQQNYLKSMMSSAEKIGIKANEEIFIKAIDPDSAWWQKYLNGDGRRIVGIDDEELNIAVLMLASIADACSGEVRFRVNDVALTLNEMVREHFIVSRIIREMVAKGVSESALVIGDRHAMTMPTTCTSWDVGLEIVDISK